MPAGGSLLVSRTVLAGRLREPATASRGKHDEGGRPAVCPDGHTFKINRPMANRGSPATARRPAQTRAAGGPMAGLSGRFCVLAKIAGP
jgi:hypothetical protein